MTEILKLYDTLKLCPFCGHHATIISDENGNFTGVECEYCKAGFHNMVDDKYVSIDMVCDYWNDRDSGVALRTIVDSVMEGVLEAKRK